MAKPCNCPAYSFPHRWGGGKCSGNRYVCTSCAQECHVKREDFGIGPYEYAGARGTHHSYADVSDCCEADVYDYYGELSCC